MSWRQTFRNQVDTGGFWEDLFKTEFKQHQFLDRPDVVCIVKEAQRDILDEALEKILENGNTDLYLSITALRDRISDTDDSALGMYFNGKQL